MVFVEAEVASAVMVANLNRSLVVSFEKQFLLLLLLMLLLRPLLLLLLLLHSMTYRYEVKEVLKPALFPPMRLPVLLLQSLKLLQVLLLFLLKLL